MACNCMEEKLKYIEDNYKESEVSYKNWELSNIRFKHTDELLFSNLNIPVILKGKNSKGKEAKKEVYYPALYCPFCGKPYREKKESEDNE